VTIRNESGPGLRSAKLEVEEAEVERLGVCTMFFFLLTPGSDGIG
jgi:hypothetical protein